MMPPMILTKDFYPRPPRGGRPGSRGCFLVAADFYPRPPRGGRPDSIWFIPLYATFLSTPSARRATRCFFVFAQSFVISIHALREEGDCPHPRCQAPADDFYPRPPRGGRPALLVYLTGRGIISIHALREEGDMRATTILCRSPYFYPRPPRGGRLFAA